MDQGAGPAVLDPLVKNHQNLLEIAVLWIRASVKFLLNESAWWTYRPTWRRNIPLEELQLVDERFPRTCLNVEEDPRYHQHPTREQEPKKKEEGDKSPSGCIWNYFMLCRICWNFNCLTACTWTLSPVVVGFVYRPSKTFGRQVGGSVVNFGFAFGYAYSKTRTITFCDDLIM